MIGIWGHDWPLIIIGMFYDGVNSLNNPNSNCKTFICTLYGIDTNMKPDICNHSQCDYVRLNVTYD
jgi:hypothetical protein